MTRRAATTIAWVIPFVCITAYVAAYALLLSAGSATHANASASAPVQLIAFLAYPLIGALIVARRPQNTVGWIFCAIGLGTSYTAFTAGYVAHALALHAGGQLAIGVIDATGNTVWPINLGLGALLLYLFPDGKLPTRRWRLVFWLTVIDLAAVSLAGLLTPGALEANGQVVNPLGVQRAATLLNVIDSVGPTIFVPLALCAVVSVIVRFRRASGTQRQQIKWFAYGAALLILVIFASVIVATLLTPSGQDPSNSIISSVGFSLGFIMLPLGAGIGVLRYRLYDIDVIIRRTLIYGALTAILLAIYFGSIVAMQQVVHAIFGAASSRQPVLIVLSTLLIAALFSPLRGSIQQGIDRRFYREKYDAARTLERFAATLRSDIDLSELREHLMGVVEKTMQPEHVSLWLSPSRRGETV